MYETVITAMTIKSTTSDERVEASVDLVSHDVRITHHELDGDESYFFAPVGLLSELSDVVHEASQVGLMEAPAEGEAASYPTEWHAAIDASVIEVSVFENSDGVRMVKIQQESNSLRRVFLRPELAAEVSVLMETVFNTHSNPA